MNAANLLAHVTGQPHAHSHDLVGSAAAVLLVLAFAFLVMSRSRR